MNVLLCVLLSAEIPIVPFVRCHANDVRRASIRALVEHGLDVGFGMYWPEKVIYEENAEKARDGDGSACVSWFLIGGERGLRRCVRGWLVVWGAVVGEAWGLWGCDWGRGETRR